jgi:hypothetical protein
MISSQELSYAQTTHTGVWVFTYDTGDAIFTPQTSTLMEKNLVIQGDGIAGPYRYTVVGAISDSTIVLSQKFLDFGESTVLIGTDTGADSMSGTWHNLDIAGGDLTSGTFSAQRISSRTPLVTPSTRLTVAPLVDVTDNDAILIFQPFNGVGSFKARSLSSVRASNTNKFRYSVEIKRTNDGSGKAIKAEITKKTSKKNQLALNNLKSGQYSVKYRVEIIKKVGGTEIVVGKTGFSPAATFSIQD